MTTEAMIAASQQLLLANVMVEENLCSTHEEACLVIEASLVGHTVDDDSDGEGLSSDAMEEALKNITLYLELTDSETASLVRKVAERCCVKDDSSCCSSSSNVEIEDELHDAPDDNDDHDDEECIGPGECVLCERHMKLTRHHLIPKATWNKLEYKISSMESLSHIAVELQRRSSSCSYKQTLNTQTIDVCSACHRHIHKTHDHWTLAVSYNTLDRLLEDPSIYKFAQWANRQRSGKHAHIVTRGRRFLKKR